MKLNKIVLTSVLATGLIPTAGAVDLLVESFETDGSTLTGDGRYVSTSEFNDGVNDHWARTDGSDISNVSGPYTGFDGTFFWAAEDINDNGGNGLSEQTIEFVDINISGFDNLSFSGLFGAGNTNGAGASNYDISDPTVIEYRIDGSGADPYTAGVCFAYQNNGDDFNEPYGLDADCNGEADAPFVQLTPAMQGFGFNIPATGNTLDLRISVTVDSGSEEFAFDDFTLTGDATGVDTPPAVTTTSPIDAAVDVAIDSNVLINFNESVDILANAVTIDCASSGVQNFPVVVANDVTSLDIDANDFANSELCTVTVNQNLVVDRDDIPDTMAADFVFSFTTVADLPPEVSSTAPADGSFGFDNTANISIDFSEVIDASANAVTLTCSSTGSVSFTGLPVDDSSTIVLDPTVDLTDSETCDLTVLAAEVVDNDGTADNMAADVAVSFIVGFPVAEVFEIQGAGMTSPFVGVTVTSNNNIVTALDTNGFYFQTPDDRDDGVLATSNGMFIFTGGAPTVAVGDLVNITAEVTEFFDSTQFTNPSTQQITVVSNGNPLPTPLILDDTFPSNDPTVFDCGDEALERECLEGMYFEMPQGFISAASVGFFGSDRGDVFVRAGSARAEREPGIEFPGLPGLPVFDGNPELIEMSVEALGLPFQDFSAGTEISAKGVIGFGFGDYELQPSELIVLNENVIPGAVRDAVGDEVTVASANIRRFFNDVNDPGEEDDDQLEDPQVYADRLVKISRYLVDDMKSPVIIALQEIENRDVLLDLVAEINAYGGPAYIPLLIEGNDQGGIDVAYMYQSGRLSGITLTQLGKDELNDFDGSLLHDRPPLRLEADVLLAEGSLPLNLLNVHLRSRGSIDDNTEGDRVRNKRLNQANSVAAMAEDILLEDPEKSLYVLGDFNAFQFTDGYVDVVGQITGEAVEEDNLLWAEPVLVDTPLTQAVQTLPANQQYSFVFGGSAQILDNALTNDIGLMNLRDIQFVRGQADATINFEEDAATTLRSTDHDGFVLYLLEDNDLIFEDGFE
ncbi:Ig-like domain-containing protein [Marinicella sp. S1101]|uniref:Ig-like domain-containing protein n=1 Tax=Marinicella marina TaxID=2996016 RepID=UPI0022610333|nr:Ig-like domain-containing protein [Marinicella marina]MCX7552466.1 Ig-like domain-containing protein [Marinicella marina]MDJ1139342.1 Ig-like domain-containing protein [Marinicella marina]